MREFSREMVLQNSPIVHFYCTINPYTLFAPFEQRRLHNKHVKADIPNKQLIILIYFIRFVKISENWVHECVIRKTFS
ncbi:hypothetical protein [Brucella melitensis]|uniref:hypothetical protein n=1 Tax=Brucella melitensis TaxID=29459 RepID=UPI0009B79E5F|nr:hypothetical protein [Brucella melitensis]